MLAASWDGQPNTTNPDFLTSHDPPPSLGVNTSARASATPLPGFIPESGATANLPWPLATRTRELTGFLKPFVTAEYRYN